jgi:hypothetical protein
MSSSAQAGERMSGLDFRNKRSKPHPILMQATTPITDARNTQNPNF